ncbi:hypothetical protein OGM63_05490, partial [Plectonema radiosum NIES-515]
MVYLDLLLKAYKSEYPPEKRKLSCYVFYLQVRGVEEWGQYGSVKNICEPKTLVETLHLLVSTYVNTNGIETRGTRGTILSPHRPNPPSPNSPSLTPQFPS